MAEQGKLTEAQTRTLREIAAGRVVYDRFDGRYRSTEWPAAARQDVVKRLTEGRYAEHGLSRGLGLTDIILTELGRAALSNYEGKVA